MSLRLIQVGLGAHGEGVAYQYVAHSKDFTYNGLVDINTDKLAECASKLGVPAEKCYSDYREALKVGNADAVLVTVLSPLHYEVCKTALENNMHVLVEKPFVLSMEEAAELVELAERKKCILMVSQNYRYYRTVTTLKRELQGASVGKPLFVDAKFYYDHKGKQYQCVMDDFMLFEMAVHHIDMMRFLFDCNICKVSGKTWNIPGSMYKGDPNVYAVYEMEDGTPVFYLGSLVSKGLSTSWEGCWRIQCENGSIHLDDLGSGYGVYVVEHGKPIKPIHPGLQPERGEGHHGVLSEFAECIREQRHPSISGKDNLHTLAALVATSESSKDNESKYPNDYIKM